jgi:hypothetical protein
LQFLLNEVSQCLQAIALQTREEPDMFFTGVAHGLALAGDGERIPVGR